MKPNNSVAAGFQSAIRPRLGVGDDDRVADAGEQPAGAEVEPADWRVAEGSWSEALLCIGVISNIGRAALLLRPAQIIDVTIA